MKLIDKPTIILTEDDKETLEKVHQFIENCLCSEIDCGKCPFSSLCDYYEGEIEDFYDKIEKALNLAFKK